MITEEDYQQLLLEIEKLNIKYYEPLKIKKMEESQLNNLKKSSYELLDKEIKKCLVT